MLPLAPVMRLEARIVGGQHDSPAVPPGEHEVLSFRFGAAGPTAGAPFAVPLPLVPIPQPGVPQPGAPHPGSPRSPAAPRGLVWTARVPPRRSERAGFQLAATPHHLAGWARVPAADAGVAARDLYARLLALLDATPYRHLLRIWNVLPRINGMDAAGSAAPMERYQAFCRGRAEAFEATFGTGFESHLPAASAVGSTGGDDLVVAFLSARAPAIPRENPRQTAAWRYPRRYGPRSPSFARAAHEAGGAELLYLSGTASIVGHASVHEDDVVEQTRETIRNLDAVCATTGDFPSCAPRLLQVYLRRAKDAPAVHAELLARYGQRVELLFLRADLCRSELLVEIEGIGTPVKASIP